MLACHNNQFPKDDEVAKQYGFLFFTTGYDRSRLFNIYHLLLVDYGIDEEALRTSVKRDSVKEMLILRIGDAMRDPEVTIHRNSMIEAIQWLEKQEGFRAKYYIRRHGGRLHESPSLGRSENFLAPEDKNPPIMNLKPREKLDALVFYAQITNQFRPDVDEDNWISLGFCTLADHDNDQRLSSAHISLVERCTFEEFWKAKGESAVVTLFDKHGLARRISGFPNFNQFMGHVNKCYENVWQLKKFTLRTTTQEVDPHRSIVVDYGYMNCRENAHQRMQLRGMYREYFERGEDEIKLHEACIAGRIFPVLGDVLGPLMVDANLLRNFYPLNNCPVAGMVW